MPLSADDRAVLELVLVRGLGFEQIGEVLGADAEEARRRAHAAIARVGGADLDPALADYLLGDAEGAEARRARDALASDAEANALARRVAGALSGELGPNAKPAPIPDPPAVETKRATDSRISPLGSLIAISVLVLAVVALVLALTGAFSDSDGEPSPVAEDEPPATTAAVPAPIRMELRPVGGAAGSGSALIGVTEEAEPFLELELSGLDPAPEGSLHLLWVDVAKGRGLPLPPAIPVGADGKFRERFVLPVELARVVDIGRSLEILLGTAQDLRAITRQVSSPESDVGPDQLPRRPGPPLLSGRIPRA